MIREELCLMFGLEGETRVQTGRGSFLLLPGGILTVSPFEMHDVICEGNAASLALLFPEDFRKRAGERRFSGYRCYEKDASQAEYISRQLREHFAGVLSAEQEEGVGLFLRPRHAADASSSRILSSGT